MRLAQESHVFQTILEACVQVLASLAQPPLSARQPWQCSRHMASPPPRRCAPLDPAPIPHRLRAGAGLSSSSSCVCAGALAVASALSCSRRLSKRVSRAGGASMLMSQSH